MKPLYNKKNEIYDYSDEGLGVEKIEGHINYQLFIKKLSARQLEILELKMEGRFPSEISRIMKISESTIRRELKKVADLAKNML